MIFLSIISLSTSVTEIAVYIVLAAIGLFVLNRTTQLIVKIDYLHDYTLKHPEEHSHIKGDIGRIDKEVEIMKKKFEDFDEKLDKIIQEVKK